MAPLKMNKIKTGNENPKLITVFLLSSQYENASPIT
jgi:hypothetical protein